jgi:MFS family permease
LEKQGLPDQKVFIPRWHDYQRAFVLLANPTVLFVMYGTFLRLSAVAVLGSFFVVYMKELAFTASTIAFLSSLFFLVAVFSPLYLRIFARYGEKRLLLVTFILSIVPMGLIPLFNEVWEFAILLSIAGCAVGLSYPLLMTIMSRSVDTHELGLAIGLRSTVNRLAASTVPIGFGLLAQGIGLEVSFYIIGGLLIAPIFYFLRATKG